MQSSVGVGRCWLAGEAARHVRRRVVTRRVLDASGTAAPASALRHLGSTSSTRQPHRLGNAGRAGHLDWAPAALRERRMARTSCAIAVPSHVRMCCARANAMSHVGCCVAWGATNSMAIDVALDRSTSILVRRTRPHCSSRVRLQAALASRLLANPMVSAMHAAVS